MFRAGQSNFSKGELAPQLYGRFDIDQYSASLRLARNVFIVKYGGVSRRVGTRLVYEILDSDVKHRLMPFTFNLEQSYALVNGEYNLKVAALGGMILEGELEVISATQTNPVQIEIAFHGHEVGDEIFFRNIEGMTELNNCFLEVLTVIDANNFTVDADGTGYNAFTGSGGGDTNTGPPPTPPPAPTPAPTPTPTPPPDVGGPDWGGDDGNPLP